MLRAIRPSAVRLAALAGLAIAASASAQTNWLPNGSGDWFNAANWAAGVPTASTPATFHFVPTAIGYTSGPTLSGPASAQGLSFGYQLAGDVVQGNGHTLTVGSGGISAFGPDSRFLRNTILAGNAAGNLSFRVSGGATLWLDGSTTALTNAGPITLANGELVLDNFSANIAARTASTANITLQSGRFTLSGASGTTTYTAGALSGSSTAGVNTIFLNPFSSANSTLQFANSGIFSTRLSTFNVLRFEVGQGVLGAAGNRITFAGTPFLGANGLLANSAGGGTVGYAVAVDNNIFTGQVIDFATWNATDGVIRAGATLTGATFASIATATASSRVQFNPAAPETATAAITTGSIRITPAAGGLSLNMGAFNLNTNALMLDGFDDFSINGTGALGAAGTRYIHVNREFGTLNTSLIIASGTNPTSVVGPGLVNLTGASVQAVGQSGANANRLDLLGGILRGTNANLGFQAPAGGSDTLAALNFRGGILEISGGGNGLGSSADFTRSLGSLDGQVRWEGGSGGFSAFNTPATVNIGGQASPATLQWGSTNFVQNGFALLLQARTANRTLNFLNPLQLDNGADYALREIRVQNTTLGAPAVLAGSITGAANADLLKTGLGTLVILGTVNTYSGATILRQGSLLVNGSVTGSGAPFNVVSGTLGGDGSIARDVFMPGGRLSPGGAPTLPGDLTINSLTVASAQFLIDIEGTTAATDYDQLNVLSSVALGNMQLVLSGAYTPVGADRFFILTLDGASPILGTFAGLPEGAGLTFNGVPMFISYQGDAGTNSITGGNDVVLYIPSPAAAAVLGLIAPLAARRRRE